VQVHDEGMMEKMGKRRKFSTDLAPGEMNFPDRFVNFPH